MKIHQITPLLFMLLLPACAPRLAEMAVGDEVGEWSVTNGELELGGAVTDSLAEQYWQVASQLLPTDSLAKYVASLRLYTDGPEGDLGGMVQIDSSNQFWQLDLDTADINLNIPDSAYVLEYHHTLIHEFGHLLSLNINQVVPTNDEYEDPIKGYLTAEGYARPKSYLGLFVEEFWPQERLIEWDIASDFNNEKKKARKLFRFFLQYPDEFVSAYAAESPEEDLAESWTFFILCDLPEEDVISSQKIRFFAQFPELLSLRKDIRAKLPFIPVDYLESFEKY